MKNKIRVLALCDSPTVSTGFAQVSKNIFKTLNDTGDYDITVLGINHTGAWYDQTKHPYKIYPAMPVGYTDMYGRGRLIQVLQGKDREIKPQFDLVFTIQDPFILTGEDSIAQGFNISKALKSLQLEILSNPNVDNSYLFNWIGYYPVDAPLKENWVKEGIAFCDYPVSYTKYATNEILKHDLEFAKTDKGEQIKVSLKNRIIDIPHGTNLKDFYPLPKEENIKFRREYFKGKVKDDSFLIININRNQIRKDLLRTMTIFKEYSLINKNAFLYLHCKPTDQGGDIWEIAKQLDLKEGTNFATTNNSFNEMYGFPVEMINKLYNIADAVISTTHGEGWGLSITESMAVGKPIIAPNNTSITEIFGIEDNDLIDQFGLEQNYTKWRGIPIMNNGYVNYGYVDNTRLRPIVDVLDGVSKLDWVFNNPDKVKVITDNAQKWVRNMSWENVCKDWDRVFKTAYADVVDLRKTPKKELGRNDTCFCGSGKKYKVCHGKL